MSMGFPFMVCLIWAAVSVSQMGKVTGCDSKIITEGMAVLNENTNKLIKEMAAVDNNDSCKNQLEMGLTLLSPQINALNNQVTLLNGRLNTCAKTKAPGAYDHKAFKSLKTLFVYDQNFYCRGGGGGQGWWRG